MTTSSIPGYRLDDPALPESPLTADDLATLKASLLFGEEDAAALRKAHDVVKDQVEAILDVWYGFVGSTPHLLAYFTDARTGEPIGAYLDGRVSCVVGTHTHTPTADDRVLPGGTAFMTDAGMCGDYNSVVGMEIEEPINRFVTRIPRGRFEPAQGAATLSGLAVETDDTTGLARFAKAVRLGGALAPSEPLLWVE